MNRKFNNMSMNRKNHIFVQKKEDDIKRIKEDTKPAFSPKINVKAKEMEFLKSLTKSQRQKENLKRCDMMF